MRPSATLFLLLCATPLCVASLRATSASARQGRQDLMAQSPSGQTLLKSLEGDKNQAPPSSHHGALSETKEQHDHYLAKDPNSQPITSSMVHANDDD